MRSRGGVVLRLSSWRFWSASERGACRIDRGDDEDFRTQACAPINLEPLDEVLAGSSLLSDRARVRKRML